MISRSWSWVNNGGIWWLCCSKLMTGEHNVANQLGIQRVAEQWRRYISDTRKQHHLRYANGARLPSYKDMVLH